MTLEKKIKYQFYPPGSHPGCIVIFCCYVFYGEGNGKPLQYSYLENSVDRGASLATLHGVTQSWTRLLLSFVVVLRCASNLLPSNLGLKSFDEVSCPMPPTSRHKLFLYIGIYQCYWILCLASWDFVVASGSDLL